MSADVWLQCQHCHAVTEWRNITYNLGPMLRAAGMHPWRDLVGMTARDAQAHLTDVLGQLLAQPGKYRAMNPENGWGDYEGALDWVRQLVEDCLNTAPDSIVGASL